MLNLNLIWIHLLILLNTQQGTAKPQGREVLENEIKNGTTTMPKAYTSQITGFNGTEYKLNHPTLYADVQIHILEQTNSRTPLPYEEEDLEGRESCPRPCTCIAGVIAHCSRQSLTDLSTITATVRDINRTPQGILSGPLPPTINAVHLGYNNITFLPENMLRSEVNDLKTVYLQNNLIRKVHPDAFLYFDKLEHLDLSQNFITNLIQPCTLGRIISRIINRNMNFNYTIDISSTNGRQRKHCLYGVRSASFISSLSASIKILSLHHNLIRNIPNHSFASLKNLEVLSLNWNQISWIGKRAFVGLHNLKVLQLRANPLTVKTAAKIGEILLHFSIAVQHPKEKYIASEVSQLFQSSRDLNTKSDVTSSIYGREKTRRRRRRRKMLMKWNRIRKRRGISQSASAGQLNALETLDLGDANLSLFPTHLPKSLVQLYLDNNGIRKLSFNSLRHLNKLEILQLGGNRIEDIPDSVFSQLNHLRLLDLSRNDLTSLGVNSFEGLMEVSSVRLHGNQRLRELSRKVFWSMPSLKLLYMQDCDIRKLPPGPWIYRLLALWIYGNPIECDCQAVLTLIMRQQHPKTLALQLDPYRALVWDDADTWKYQRPTKTTCGSPSQFSGYPLQEVRMRDMRCTTQDWYDTTVHRNIATMSYNPDYQQDEPFNPENQTLHETFENYFTSTEDDLITKLYNTYKDELTDKEHATTKWEPAISSSQYANYDMDDEFSYTNYSDLFAKVRGGVDQQEEVNVTTATNDDVEMDTMSGKRVSQYEDKDFIFSGDEDMYKIADQSKENMKQIEDGKNMDIETSEEEGTEWVIELPASAEVEYPDNKEDEKEVGSTINSELLDKESTENKIPADTFPANKPEDDSNYGIFDMDLEYDFLPGVQHGNTGDQGYAPFIYYDNGAVNIDPNKASSFEEEVLRGMDFKQKSEYKRRVEQTDLWEVYNEYYTNEEFSGDIGLLINDDFYNEEDGNAGSEKWGGVLKPFGKERMTIDDLAQRIMETYQNRTDESKAYSKDEHITHDELNREGST